MSWERTLRELAGSPPQSDRILRHNVAYIPAHRVAEQHYCEMKVEQDFIHGEIPTEAKLEGKKLHEELLKAKPAEMEDIIKKIREKPLYLVSNLPLAGKMGDVAIVGVPDLIVFVRSAPILILELKTVSGRPRVWLTHLIQAQLYGLLAELMGFNVVQLRVVVAVVKRGVKLKKREFILKLVESLLKNEVERLQQDHKGNVMMPPDGNIE